MRETAESASAPLEQQGACKLAQPLNSGSGASYKSVVSRIRVFGEKDVLGKVVDRREAHGTHQGSKIVS